MRSGPMRYNIDFYAKTNVKDDYSGYAENYTFSFCTKADVKHMGGTQQIVNDQIYPSADIQFTLRYRDSVTDTMRIKFREEVYEITHISVIEPKRGLVIQCMKMQEM